MSYNNTLDISLNYQEEVDNIIINRLKKLNIESPTIENNKKSYYLPKIKNRFTKKWFPNTTGRDMPMTSRFGIENNRFNTFLIKSPIKFSNLSPSIKLPKLKYPVNLPKIKSPIKFTKTKLKSPIKFPKII